MSQTSQIIRVRDANAGDVSALVGFNLALARETEELQLDRARLEQGVRRALADTTRARYFLATAQAQANGEEAEASQPVGCTMVTTELSDWRDGEFWWIQSVYVAPAYRGRGVFGRLYRHIETRAQALPRVVGLRLYVERDNARARAIYNHLGLVETRYHMLERDFVLDRSW